MVFKRRDARPWGRIAREFIYPRGGWKRAAYYVTHRLRRLPDAPHRIARGIFAGVFISFTPLFGFHFIGGALIAWLIRGNILAALLATFVGNPVTMPFIAITAVETGHWMLGIEKPLDLVSIFAAFSSAGTELWQNLVAAFNGEPRHWSSLHHFFQTIYLPYLVGGIIPGIVVSAGFYYGSLPIIGAYQKHRKKKNAERAERRLAARTAARARAEARDWQELTGGDDASGPPLPPSPDDPGPPDADQQTDRDSMSPDRNRADENRPSG